MLLKIGELAKRAGLTVRALHHYDAIGLLSPSVRTQSGSRRYGPQDLIRLHRIQAMKQMGYALPEIRVALDAPERNPLAIIEQQIAALEAQIQRAQTLSSGLQQLARQITTSGQASADDWLNQLEMLAIYQQHFSAAEVSSLRNPQTQSIQEIDAQWAALVPEVRQAMQQALPTDSAAAHALAWRWVHLVIASTNNNPALANKLKAMQERETRAQQIIGIDRKMFAWIGEALAHARVALFAKHLSPEQTETIRQRQLKNMAHMNDWPQLVAEVHAHMAAGTPTKAKPVKALMARWQQLFRDSYCGDDAELEAKVRTVFAQEPELSIGVGVDAALMAYVQQAKSQRQAAKPPSPKPPKASP